MKNESAIITPKDKEEREMTQLLCTTCDAKGNIKRMDIDCVGDTKVWGIIQCLHCNSEYPFMIQKNYIRKLDISLPGQQSNKLNKTVPIDLIEDIKEAERANFNQCYKACVTMCRRALQLGLIDKNIVDGKLSAMLQEALKNKLITQDIYNLATSIKGYGDIGAHRRDKLEPQEVNMVIHAAVRMLNELFK